MKIGDIIMLKSYERYGDYKDHEGQKATIVAKEDFCTDFTHEIMWEDENTSLAHINNMMPTRIDNWKEELQ